MFSCHCVCSLCYCVDQQKWWLLAVGGKVHLIPRLHASLKTNHPTTCLRQLPELLLLLPTVWIKPVIWLTGLAGQALQVRAWPLWLHPFLQVYCTVSIILISQSPQAAADDTDDTQHVEIFHRLLWFTETALAPIPGMYVKACKPAKCSAARFLLYLIQFRFLVLKVEWFLIPDYLPEAPFIQLSESFQNILLLRN